MRTISCKHCGTEVMHDAREGGRYCNECGVKLTIANRFIAKTTTAKLGRLNFENSYHHQKEWERLTFLFNTSGAEFLKEIGITKEEFDNAVRNAKRPADRKSGDMVEGRTKAKAHSHKPEPSEK